MTAYSAALNETSLHDGAELDFLDSHADAELSWHVLWTRSNFEKKVYEDLSRKGYEVFLPEVLHWTQRRGSLFKKTVPMFKSYLFVRASVTKEAYIDISGAKGLVQILGPRWDKLATVSEREIESIRLAANCNIPAMPYPYMRTGSPVRVIRGKLAGAEGRLVKKEHSKGLFVISVELLHQSVAVEIDCTDIVPL